MIINLKKINGLLFIFETDIGNVITMKIRQHYI